MANESKPLFRPGSDVTVKATAAVTGKTFVDVTAAADVSDGLFKAATAAALVKPFGVAAQDIASGAVGPVLRGGIVNVTAGGAISVGAQVEVGSGGKAVVLSTGIAVGKALSVGTSNNDVLIALDI